MGLPVYESSINQTPNLHSQQSKTNDKVKSPSYQSQGKQASKEEEVQGDDAQELAK